MWVHLIAVRAGSTDRDESGVQSPSCKEANQVSSKLGALIILKGLLGRDLNYTHEALHEAFYTGPETVVDALPVVAAPGIEIEES